MTLRVAIVGGAAITALGEDLESTRAALRAGLSAVAPWPQPEGWGGQVPRVARQPGLRPTLDEDPTQRMLGRHGEWLDVCARRAHEEAGLRALPRERVGLFAAVGMVDSPPEELAPAVNASRDADGVFVLERFCAGGFRAMHPLWPLAMLGNVAAGHVAIGLDLRGDNTVLASEADAGGRALGEALVALRLGTVDAVLAGGVSEPVTEQSLLRRDLRGTLLRDSGAPGRLPPGEGGAVVVLESEASARARGAAVQGWLLGHGMAQGEGREEARAGAVAAALADAGLCAPDVTLHLTDEPSAAGGRGSSVPALGHLLGAQAALSVLLVLAAAADAELRARLAPGFRPGGGPLRALVSVTSDGGSAAALVVEPCACAS